MDMIGKLEQTRTADGKGRISLGSEFANRHVLVRRLETGEILIELARVVPEREAWLYDNDEALASVRRGLKQAREGARAESPPDPDADTTFADSIDD